MAWEISLIKQSNFPDWICHDCAMLNGGVAPNLATYHEDICDVCFEKKSVTQPRDYKLWPRVEARKQQNKSSGR